MKRSVIMLLAGIAAIILILLFKPKPPTINESVVAAKPTSTNITPIVAIKNAPAKIMAQVLPTVVTNTEPQISIDVAKAQSIADWTNTIPNIKLWSHFRTRSSWVADQTDTNNYPAMLLTGVGGKTVQFRAKLISIDAMGDHIRAIEIHTPNMNIDEIREFGNILLQMMGKDETGFNAWCDKVGNNWIDQPEWTSGGSRAPDGNKFYGFGTHITFSNEKPWYILFFITDP